MTTARKRPFIRQAAIRIGNRHRPIIVCSAKVRPREQVRIIDVLNQKRYEMDRPKSLTSVSIVGNWRAIDAHQGTEIKENEKLAPSPGR